MGSARTALIALVALGAACSSSSAADVPAQVGPNGCRAGPPEAGVYQPNRLTVLDPCRDAVGVVVGVARAGDGDQDVWFTPDPGYELLLNPANVYDGRPEMLAAITPDCAGSPADAGAAAKCPRSKLPIPSVGDHIAIKGPFVFDTSHAWNEIHPVDTIVILGPA